MTRTEVLDDRQTAVILPFRPAPLRARGSRMHRKRATARAAARVHVAQGFAASDNIVVLAEAKRRFISRPAPGAGASPHGGDAA